MPVIRPFRALRYNPAVVGDLSAVVAPPYDVISKAQQNALHERSPYNVVHLILNRAADRYGMAAQLLNAWRRDGLLIREPRPALGYYVENFALRDGGARERQGIIGAVRLEPFRTGRIRPHERTFALAKEDRLRILRACRTNLSPIFGLFANKAEVLDPLRALDGARKPETDVTDDAGVRHRLWLVTEPGVIDQLAGALANDTVVIADGHHRYETALVYRDELRAAGATHPDAPHNYILMYLTSMSHPGLVILPTHRVLHGLGGLDPGDVETRLRRHFRLNAFAASARHEFLACLRQLPQWGRFGIGLARSDRLFIATLKDPALIDQHAAGLAPVVRRLDVTVLDSVVLRGLFGLDCSAAAQEGRLMYTHDDGTALDMLGQGAQVAFLMNPPRIEDVQAVCAAGETMPEKSTYFYPKLLTGLVFHSLEEEAAAAPAFPAGARHASARS